MQVLEKLNSKQCFELAQVVIEVEGKAMNRTALGVVAAIFKLYPNVTFGELKSQSVIWCINSLILKSQNLT